MAKLANLARMTTTTTGSETMTLIAAVPGRLTFVGAGIVDGDVVSYGIVEGNNSEVGRGTYGASGSTLTRSVLNSTNSGSPIVLGGSAHVFVSALAQDVSMDGWLPASQTWTYASADAPTYTFNTSASNISNIYTPGMRLKCEIDGSDRYLICTGATGSTVTVYGGTDYVMSASPITNPYFSTQKAPLGFPLDPTKWTEKFEDVSSRQQATPTFGTWYNVGTSLLSIPIGIWKVSYLVAVEDLDTATTVWSTYVTLSTANNSQSDLSWTSLQLHANLIRVIRTIYRDGIISVSSKTTYYMNAKSAYANLDSLNYRGDQSTTFIRAVCAYL